MSAFTVLFAAMQLLAPASTPPAAAPAAAVEIVLFSDFQCPFCAQLAGPMRELQRTPPSGVAVDLRFMQFPLGIHPNAPLAHQAALAARAQGKFWEMHDLLFANRSRAQRDDVVEYARQLGLDVDRFQQDLDSEAVKQTIEADRTEGARRGVDATPTFFVNGRPYIGAHSLAQLKQIVVAEQQRTRAMAEISDAALSRGPASAPVTIEVFADLQSPVSRPALAVVDAVAARYPSDVRVQFRNFPLAFHPHAGLVHEAAMAAARQGRFWDFVQRVVDHPESTDEAALLAIARGVGLDPAAVAESLGDHRYAARVLADVEEGQRGGVRGSPAIVVNGQRFDGVPGVQALTASVDAAVATSLTKRP
jgi:protein-disulfide isomerase